MTCSIKIWFQKRLRTDDLFRWEFDSHYVVLLEMRAEKNSFSCSVNNYSGTVTVRSFIHQIDSILKVILQSVDPAGTWYGYVNFQLVEIFCIINLETIIGWKYDYLYFLTEEHGYFLHRIYRYLIYYSSLSALNYWGSFNKTMTWFYFLWILEDVRIKSVLREIHICLLRGK